MREYTDLQLAKNTHMRELQFATNMHMREHRDLQLAKSTHMMREYKNIQFAKKHVHMLQN